MPLWQTSRMEPITPAPTPVYLISPAGALAPDAPVERALENLRRAGFAPKLDRAALKRRQRFAGSDDDRVAAFERAAAQDASIVMITRGGYGLTRILPRLDFKALARSRKRWVGLSDFTAFQLGMLARAKAATWAGPSLIADFGAESFEALDEITVGTFQDAMSGVLEVLGFRYGGPAGVEARGTLWGGNLSVVCSLLGTPWFPKVDGGILYLEDVNEHPYRIERMLTQLLHAGVLARQKAVVLGQFTNYKLAPHDKGFRLQSVVDWLRTQIKAPVLTNLPFGHVPTKVLLPVGAQVSLSVEGRDALIYWGHAH